MTIYVDDARHPFGRMIMCHMWTDGPLEELYAMADRIGVARKWLQQPPKAPWVHFDISLGVKAKAIRAGAMQTDRYGPVEHCARLAIASGDPAAAARGASQLKFVAECRELDALLPPA